MSDIFINGAKIRLDPSKSVGQGGEADVYDIGKGKVVKVFKSPNHPDYVGLPLEQKNARERIETHQKKLPAFPRSLPKRVVAPLDLATDQSGQKILGYTMPFLGKCEVLMRYSERRFREAGVPNDVVVAIFNDLHATVRATHAQGVVMGDCNDLNVLVSGKEAHIIDADSFQFGSFLCKVFTPRFVDPLLCNEKEDRLMLARPYVEDSDWYAFSVMLMQCLLYVNPYGGVYRPKNTKKQIPHDARPLHRITVFHDEVIYPKPAVHYRMLPDDLLEYFHQLFEKDRRGEFPAALLQRLVWQKCGTCGTEHARAVCPNCMAVAPAAVKEVTVVRGTVTASTIFTTRGVILCVTVQHGSLRWLYHDNGEFKREDSSLVTKGPLDPQIRFRIAGRRTLLGKNQEVVTITPGTPQIERQVVGSYGLLPIFDTNAEGRYWVSDSTLMRDGALGPERIGDVLRDQTLFWVGPKFGFGFYRAGMLHVAFVFNAKSKGINDTVKMPPIRGKLIDATCSFTDKLCWFFSAFQIGGETIYQCVVLEQNGAVVATEEVRESDATWILSMRGAHAAGNFLLVPTDEGVVRIEVVNGRVTQTRSFPDTEPFVDADTKLFATAAGLHAVGKSKIVTLKIT
jgi:H/ACA ribonucleoprotein complex subunit 3